MMKTAIRLSVVFALVSASLAPAQTAGDRLELGQLAANAATVAFVRAASGEWGIEMAGGNAPRFMQPKPAQIQLYRGATNTVDLAAGYQSVRKDGEAVVATARVSDGASVFAVEDRWQMSGAVLSLDRKVTVSGAGEDAGFYSAIRLETAPTSRWSDGTFLVPGLLYGNSEFTGGRSPTSAANDRRKRFDVREDYLSAPLFGVYLKDGNWVGVLDPAPRGDTTQAENTASAATTLIDERMQFGALGAREIPEAGIELGFCFPGTTSELGGGGRRGGPTEPAGPVMRRRYHPVKAGFAQSYRVDFRFGKNESFVAMQKEAWRWAWSTLQPKVKPVDLEVARRTLMDHLSDRVVTQDGRTGVPFEIDAVTGTPSRLADKIIMGFCGKNLEAADELLREGDRDKTERGQKMRRQGLAIIESLIRLVPMNPPAGIGFSMQTGQPVSANFVPGFTTRMPAEDLAVLINTYRREKAAGHDHPEWLAWIKTYCDWLLTQQGADGSFPAAWEGGTGKVIRDGKTTTYVPVPVLVRLSEVTGDKKYLDSATQAAEFIWTNYGSKGVYLGATGTGNNIADKEAGMLSLEAFLALYENNKDAKWLERAKSAADYTESWIWLWNVPMPADADDKQLHWKKGVPTIGVNGIGSDVIGGVDQYLDWAVPSYARLYQLTKDEHYLDVAYILLHGTKAMLALPGRTYDLLGPGWHQEHWNLGPGRKGMGAHRNWLVWVSANHINGIVGLEALDPNLYQQLAKGK